MEDIIINIDSRYRDVKKYPSECNFQINLEKYYKNIISIKIISIELNNSIRFLNYKNIHSSKKNNSFTVYIPNKLNDPEGTTIILVDNYNRTIDSIIDNINNQLKLFISTMKTTEKYFYFFYLKSLLTITIISSTINYTLNLIPGWYSIFGLYNIISNYIINLNLSNFTIPSFTMEIFDRRYINSTRLDTITLATISLNTLKSDLYQVYLSNNYTPTIGSSGILDRLLNDWGSIYYISSNNTTKDDKIFNLKLVLDNITVLVSFINSLSTYYFYNNLSVFNTLNSSIEDILSFEINFNLDTLKSNYIKDLSYPSVGFLLGFRWASNNFILSSKFIDNQTIIIASDLYNIYIEDYILLKINDWGNIDFYNIPILSKIIFSNCVSNNKIDDYIKEEVKFRQPINIQKLDIQLIDYLGNLVDLNGKEFSFTLKLGQIVKSGDKDTLEKKDLVF